MHDAKVHVTDFGGVVIKKATMRSSNAVSIVDFFFHFALNAGAIGGFVPGEERLIGVVHVAADADRPFGNQALFPCLLTADVMQHRVAMGDQRVGDDLLVGRIVLRLGRAGGRNCFRAKGCAADIFRLEVQSVKTSELVEEAAPMTNTFSSAGSFVLPRLERVGRADLRSKKVQAGVGIGLPAIRKMLVRAPTVNFNCRLPDRKCRRPTRVLKVKSWPWRADDIGVAVDPAEPDAAGNIRRPNAGPVWTKL